MKELFNNPFTTMKTTTYLSALLVLFALFTSCNKDENSVTPSSQVTTTTLEMGEINSLDVSDAFSVFVTLADQETPVTIEASSNLHPYIRIENYNGLLRIELDDHINISKGNAVLNVYVTARTMENIEASGASYVELVNPLYGDALDIELSGASLLRATVHTGELNGDLSGASALQIQGSTVNFRIDASGSSTMEDFNFLASHLDAHLDGACQISLSVQDALEVTASGSSIVRYKGDAVITKQNLSGSSGIVKVN